MSGAWEGGKGSRQRPIKDKEYFEAEWDRIFETAKKEKEAKAKRLKDKKDEDAKKRT